MPQLPPEAAPDPIQQEARALFAAGRFAAAEQRFRNIIRQTPDDKSAALYLAQLALLDNRLDQAEHWLETRCQDLPAAVPLYRILYYRQDRWADARPFAGISGQAGLARVLRELEGLPSYRISGLGGGAQIAFALSEPLPVVRARLNDQEDVLLVIDTGAGDLILDRRLATGLGLSLSQPEPALFAGGLGGELQYAPLERLQFGTLQIDHLPVQVMEVNRLLAGFFDPHGIDGIIGLNLLRHFDVQLDFGHGELRLYPPGSRPLGPRSGFPCWLAGEHQLITWGRLRALELLWFLDSGMAGFSALLSRQTAQRAGLDPAQQARPVQAFGGGGMLEAGSLPVDRVCIGDVCRASVQAVAVEDFPLETHFGFFLGGLLAYDFFKPFTLDIDFQGMRARLS